MRHLLAATSLLALILPACTQAAGPETGPETAPSAEAARACIAQLAEGTAYLEQHVAARTEKMKVIRFASEADMNAYIEQTDTFELHSVNMPGLSELIETQYALPAPAETYAFEETTDEGAETLIEQANDCALKLIE